VAHFKLFFKINAVSLSQRQQLTFFWSLEEAVEVRADPLEVAVVAVELAVFVNSHLFLLQRELHTPLPLALAGMVVLEWTPVVAKEITQALLVAL